MHVTSAGTMITLDTRGIIWEQFCVTRWRHSNSSLVKKDTWITIGLPCANSENWRASLIGNGGEKAGNEKMLVFKALKMRLWINWCNKNNMHWCPRDLQKMVIDGEGTLSLFSGRGSIVMWHASCESPWCKLWCQSKTVTPLQSGGLGLHSMYAVPLLMKMKSEFSLSSCVHPLTYITFFCPST